MLPDAVTVSRMPVDDGLPPCRGLFERHKLLLSLQMAARIAASLGMLAQDQWQVLLEGTRGLAEAAPSTTNPAASWLSERAWQDIANLSTMPAFEVRYSLGAAIYEQCRCLQQHVFTLRQWAVGAVARRTPRSEA